MFLPVLDWEILNIVEDTVGSGENSATNASV